MTKSSYSYERECVEVHRTWHLASGDEPQTTDYVHVADSKNPQEPVLCFTRGEWDAFIKGVKDGEFDVKNLTKDPYYGR